MPTIRALRRARGWSQYELALRIGVHPQAVYLWEGGRRIPQVPQKRKLGVLFGLCSDDIELIPPGDRPHDAEPKPASHPTLLD
jgi:DNA-binding XRE family transcriptional regulator